jgi:regulator of protease activity HflC (stomatin/prohibitin superfamily)
MTDPQAGSAPVQAPVPALAPPAELSSAEANRQARLIARCADASWLSLCLPDDRREARALRDAANVRAALRTDVTRLLSEGKCDEAVRVALAGADMALAWEVRNMNFCAPAPVTAEAAADPN